MKTIDMIQVGYDSEWFLSKAFQSLIDPRIQEQINLAGICGIQDDTNRAIISLKERKAKKDLVRNYGARNLSAEIKSIDTIIERLQNGTLEYHHVNGDFSLPLKAHEKEERIVYICSKNYMHLGYFKDAIAHGAHVILEKPAIVLMNEEGESDDSQLKELEEIIQNCPDSIKLIDAEHYAHKKASTIFYSKIEKILRGQKIAKINGTLYEPDQADKPRNLNLFNRSPSRTGLLTDTGVHLLSFVSNLGASASPLNGKIRYGVHPAYKVETSVTAEYLIINDTKRSSERKYFAEGATISLDLEKFSKERKGIKPAQTKKKRVVFTLEDSSKVVLNLVTNRVFKVNAGGRIEKFEINNYDSNEYIKIMQDAYNTITGKQKKARTELRDSLKTMKTIYETYRLAPIVLKENIEERY